MKTLITLLLLSATTAQAADPTLLCRMKEKKGHQTEDYSVRLKMSEGEAEFNLRLYPRVVAQLGTTPDGKDQLIIATLLDYDMPDSETVGDMMVGNASAANYLDFLVKLDHTKDHEVGVSCGKEE